MCVCNTCNTRITKLVSLLHQCEEVPHLSNPWLRSGRECWNFRSPPEGHSHRVLPRPIRLSLAKHPNQPKKRADKQTKIWYVFRAADCVNMSYVPPRDRCLALPHVSPQQTLSFVPYTSNESGENGRRALLFGLFCWRK